MTSNQIAYWNLQESKRHNLQTEGVERFKASETARHNYVTEELTSAQLAETKRHNIAGENFNLSQLAENTRHNLVGETEQNRHNLQTEKIARAELSERKREWDIQHETIDVPKAGADIDRTKADTSRIEKQTNLTERQTQTESWKNWLGLGGLIAGFGNAFANIYKAVRSGAAKKGDSYGWYEVNDPAKGTYYGDFTDKSSAQAGTTSIVPKRGGNLTFRSEGFRYSAGPLEFDISDQDLRSN